MPTTPTPEALIETLRGAIAVADQLKADARWLWIDGYWPAGRNPDRPTRVHPKTDRADPDHVPGERLALGIGRDDVRAAWERSAQLVVEAHRLAGRAVGHYTGRTMSMARRRPARGDEYGLFVDNTVRRLRWLADRDVAHDSGDQPRLDAHAACVTLVEAHAALAKVLADVDGTGALPLQRRCKNCHGPAAEGRTECWKCINYRMRNKGRTRPAPRHLGAFDALDRRRQRGEDYGETPLPRGRYVEGRWTEAS